LPSILVFAFLLSIPLGLDLYLPVPEDNPMTDRKLELGQKLFHDRRLSRTRTVSCASCHDPARAFSDNRPLSIGVFGRVGNRHAPALINRGYGRSFFWDGRAATLEEQVLKPIQDPNEMDLTLDEASSRVGLSPRAIAHALASYIRSILSGDSPYDRYIAGDRRALTADQQRGLQIFRNQGNCGACHSGPTFSDEGFHNTGVAWKDGKLTDQGRADGIFKTPTLREIARTAPYMHDGSLATLSAVVDFYNDGGRKNPFLDSEIRPLQLIDDDKRALIVFLESLSGRISEGRP
jgi:cytochrome c peroxidase